MLVLSRKPGERIIIGQNIAISVLRVHGNRVQLGIECPPHVPIIREELRRRGARQVPPPATETETDESPYYAEFA